MRRHFDLREHRRANKGERERKLNYRPDLLKTGHKLSCDFS